MSANILGPEWNLSSEGIRLVTEDGTIKDPKAVLKNALNSDIRSICTPTLSADLSKSSLEKKVLQIQKIRNVSAPKAKEESQAAPRMLKLTLTDGETDVHAIELASIPSISREKTAPGTKVLINNARIVSRYVLITPQNFSVLGGQVEHLYERWQLSRSVQQNHQHTNNTGAPPWVAFGCKLVMANDDKPFKSLEKAKEDNTSSEFDQQRKDAIAEASTGAVKKTFGGRVKQTVQQPVHTNTHNRGRPNDHERGRRGRFATRDDDDDVERLQKPSEKVSLFSFLEDKLPANDVKKTTYAEPQFDYRPQRGYEAKRSENIQATSNNSKDQLNSNNSKSRNSGNTKSTNNESASKPSNQAKPTRSQNGIGKWENPSNQHQFRTENEKFHQPKEKFSSNQSNYNNKSTRQQYSNTPQQDTGNQHNQKYQNNQSQDVQQLSNNMSRMSVNNEFASRSLRQHLNLVSTKPQETRPNEAGSLKVGDQCLAKYWEDGKFYPATVAAITEKTYAVQFKGYGNIEEVLKQDCFSASNKPTKNSYPNNYQQNFSGGSMEFRSRRGPPKN